MELRFQGADRGSNDPQVNERNVAQAVELVRALLDKLNQMTHELNQMTHELVRLKLLDTSCTSSRASTIRCEAAALRRDINEAQTHIALLQLGYLNGNGHAQPRLPEQPRRSVTRLQRRF